MTQHHRLRGRAIFPLALALLLAAPDRTSSQTQAPSRNRVRESPSKAMPPAEEGSYQRDERAEKVLQAAIKAHGGAEAISGRKTIFIKWKITNYDYPQPEVGTVTVWFKRPFRIRREVVYSHKKELTVYDGRRAWIDTGKGPQLVSAFTARLVERGVRELDSPLLYTEGNLRYLSTAKDLKGRLTQKLSWRFQGYARDIMIDVNTNHLLVVGEYDTPAGAVSRVKVFDDFRPVQGLTLPWFQETYRESEKYSDMEILEVKFDLPVDDSLFEYPGPPPEEASPPSAPPGGRR